MPVLNNANLDQDERVVEEVHCSECGLPISTIPNWYASVNVKFTCDNCRQKSPRLAAPLAAVEGETARSAEGDEDADADSALDEEVDEVELDEAESDSEE